MTTPVDDLLKVHKILNQNRKKDFVKRIQHPEIYPKLYDNPGGIFGAPSTHSMAAEQDEHGDWFVFPTVVNRPGSEGLTRLKPAAALDYAKRTGEHIPFKKSGDDAIWFSKAYKRVWDKL